MQATRKRSFGGGAAILWLRKKREQTTVLLPQSTICSSKVLEQPSLQWDENRCRLLPGAALPAMGDHNEDEQTTVSSSSSQASSVTNSPDLLALDLPSSSSAQKDDAEEEKRCESSWIHSNKEGPGTTGKRKSFGSKRRWVSIERADGEPSWETRVAIASSAAVPAPEHDDGLPDTTRSDGLKRPKKKKQETDSVAVSQSSELDFDDNLSQPATNKTTSAISQPNSNTSLDVALRFFQELDANHPLTIEAASSSDIPQTTSDRKHFKPSGRTRHILTLTNNERLRQDYTLYCSVCEDAHVEPLSLDHFVKQRKLTRNNVYDGFLDD